MSGFGLSDLGALGLISFGEFLWSLLIIFFMIIFFIILFTVIVDIFRSDDLGGWGKAGWAFFIIVLPFLGLFIYLIVRGKSMGERQVAQQVKQQKQFDQYVREVGGSGQDPAEQSAKAKQLLDAGTIDQAEFDAIKKKALG